MKSVDWFRSSAAPKQQEKAVGIDYILERVSYDPTEGKFYYKRNGRNRSNTVGKEIVPTRTSKYGMEIFLSGKGFLAQRVAVICMTQTIPDYVIFNDGDIRNLKYTNLSYEVQENLNIFKEEA